MSITKKIKEIYFGGVFFFPFDSLLESTSRGLRAQKQKFCNFFSAN